ncbi:hypothetical protein TNCV_757841 [Trichonephila clavipes]|nr:hypothetical protein TNCV_757841 [Trichonephila clavipes]
MDLIRGAGKSSRMSLINKPSCQILSKALAMSRKSIPVALQLGGKPSESTCYSEQLMNCRALWVENRTGLGDNKINSSAVLIQALQKTKPAYFAQTRK